MPGGRGRGARRGGGGGFEGPSLDLLSSYCLARARARLSQARGINELLLNAIFFLGGYLRGRTDR